MTEPASGRNSMRSFFVIWVGQVISVIGSDLTGFALGVWVYQRTGSVTQFTLIVICTVAPGILLSPLVGALVDRWDRRSIMILSNVASGVSTLVIALLFLLGSLQLWHIWILMAAISTSTAFLLPSYSASIALIVPLRHLGRASGLVQFGQAAAEIVSPLLAGFLLLTIQMHGVLLIDFVSYLVAIATLLFVPIPRVEVNPVRNATDKSSLLREVAYGWAYIKERPGLLGLMIFFAMTNFTLGMSNVLTAPLLLSFASPAVYGTVVSTAGIGLLLGSTLMGVWGGPQRRIYGVFSYGLILGGALILEGLRPNAVLIGAALFISSFVSPIANGCCMPIIQSKTLPHVQGRVFATVRFIAGWTVPFSYIIAGVLADRVFTPLLEVDGPLAGSVGKIIGIGPGRGIGLLLVVVGVVTVLATLRGYFYPRLRFIEAELPDAINEWTAKAT